LDPETQLEWELITASRIDIPSTTELRTFLGSRCKSLEMLQLTQTLKMSTSTLRSSHPVGNNVSKPSYTHVAKKLQCALCKDSHRLFKCDKFLRMEVEQRLNHVKQSKLCFNCLQTFVKNHTCSKQVCYHCNKKHHTLLHLNVQSRQNSRGPTNHNAPTNVKGPLTNSKSTVHEQSNALQKLVRTAHLRANHKIKHFWLQKYLNLGTNQDNMFHVEHCWTVLPNVTSLQRNVYNV